MTGSDRIFIGTRHSLFSFAKSVFDEVKEGIRADEWYAISPTEAEGLNGEVKYDKTALPTGSTYQTSFNSDDYLDIKVR